MDQRPADSVPDSLSDSRADSWLDSWPGHVATAVVTGVVTTWMPVQRWAPAARWGLHGGMGLLSAAATTVFLRNPETFRDGDQGPTSTPGPAATAALALGLGALVAGASRGGEAADAWAERRLAARGVRRPRVWMGVVAAGASLAMSISDSRRDARKAAATADDEHVG